MFVSLRDFRAQAKLLALCMVHDWIEEYKSKRQTRLSERNIGQLVANLISLTVEPDMPWACMSNDL